MNVKTLIIFALLVLIAAFFAEMWGAWITHAAVFAEMWGSWLIHATA